MSPWELPFWALIVGCLLFAMTALPRIARHNRLRRARSLLGPVAQAPADGRDLVLRGTLRTGARAIVTRIPAGNEAPVRAVVGGETLPFGKAWVELDGRDASEQRVRVDIDETAQVVIGSHEGRANQLALDLGLPMATRESSAHAVFDGDPVLVWGRVKQRARSDERTAGDYRALADSFHMAGTEKAPAVLLSCKRRPWAARELATFVAGLVLTAAGLLGMTDDSELEALTTPGSHRIVIEGRPARPPETILYDAEARPNDPRIENDMSADDEAHILDTVFPKRLSDSTKCPRSTAGEDLEHVRKRGAIVPRVTAKASGAFTKSGAAETLYLMSVGECGASHAAEYGSDLLVVTEGKSVRARVPMDGGHTLRGLFDLDDDGRLEVLFLYSHVATGGTVLQRAALSHIDPDSKYLETIDDFGDVSVDTCGSVTEMGTRENKFSVITALTHFTQPWDIHVHRTTRPCKPD